MNKIIKRKILSDTILKTIIFIFSLVGVVSLFVMFGFIIKGAFPAYRDLGFWHIYFTSDFSTGGIWGALLVTIFTSMVSVMIATPLALRASIFMKYRIKRIQKPFKILIDVLAGIPSVIFGVFALKSLNSFSSIFIGEQVGSLTIFNATIMLTMMVFPTLVSLITNQLNTTNEALLHASMSLGNSKTTSIYKVTKKSIRSGVYVAVIVALGRAIGETMALSMILSGTSSAHPLNHGLSEFLKSPFATLGVEIASNMFTDSSDPIIRSKAFAAGIGMFAIVSLLVWGATQISKQKVTHNKNPWLTKRKINKIIKKSPTKTIGYMRITIKCICLPLSYVKFAFVWTIETFGIARSLFFSIISTPINKFLFPNRTSDTDLSQYYSESSKSKVHTSYDFLRILLEVLSIFIIIGSISWILTDILSIGITKFEPKDGDITQNGVMNAMVWTILLIITSIGIAIPFALGTALYLSEYAKNRKSGNVIKFFLDALGGTPSILFGIFGMVLFLDLMKLNSHLGSTSLIAGGLTMSLVILPTFTRSIEQVLISIPESQRMAAYALGSSKFETIRKVILPKAIPGIVSGIILSMGRVVSETAPVFLTLGMSFNKHFDLLGRGQTLTTKILSNQIFGTSAEHIKIDTSYKYATAAIILVATIILLSYSIEPITQFIGKISTRKAGQNVIDRKKDKKIKTKSS